MNTLNSLGFSKSIYDYNEEQSACKIITISNGTDMKNFFKGEELKSFISDFSSSTTSEFKKAEISFFSKFDTGYNFSENKLIPCEVPMPTVSEIEAFCKEIIQHCDLSMEVLPTSLLYLEKLMLNSGNLMNSNNWRKLA